MLRRKRRPSRRVAARAHPRRVLAAVCVSARASSRRSEDTTVLHGSTVRVFRSRGGPGPRRARCPRAGRRALVVVRGAAAAGRALRASPRLDRCRRAATAPPRPHRGRCALGAGLRGLRWCVLQRYRTATADVVPRGQSTFARRSVPMSTYNILYDIDTINEC